jgi:MoaA/NifB/PqqE/SkfB family radical SAM enzyme
VIKLDRLFQKVSGRIRSFYSNSVPGEPNQAQEICKPGSDAARITKALEERLGSIGLNTSVAQQLILGYFSSGGEPDEYQLLQWLMENHPEPHWINYLLGLYEFEHAILEVRSLPTNVWMDISSICTVECRFCKYTHEQLPKQNVSLEQVKSISWLKYVRLLNLTAGTAEALANPEFIEIFDYLRDTFPHLHITLLTNGRTLNPEILEALRGRLDALHVSMNASSEEDYNRIIARGSWPSFLANMEAMKTIMAGVERPRITASFVMMRWNLDRALSNLEFASKHGANLVLFHHYYPSYVKDIHADLPSLEQKFDERESLYFDRERSDLVFGQLAGRAKDLGVEVQVPPAFATKVPANIYYGARSYLSPPKDCIYPWTNMYMLWGFKSKREEITLCCGLASDIGVYFDRDSVASIDGLRAIWNSPTMKAYRNTANGENTNPICKLCREIDRFDPTSTYPDQKEFFAFNNLPVPPHFSSGEDGQRTVTLFKGKKSIELVVQKPMDRVD